MSRRNLFRARALLGSGHHVCFALFHPSFALSRFSLQLTSVSLLEYLSRFALFFFSLSFTFYSFVFSRSPLDRLVLVSRWTPFSLVSLWLSCLSLLCLTYSLPAVLLYQAIVFFASVVLLLTGLASLCLSSPADAFHFLPPSLICLSACHYHFTQHQSARNKTKKRLRNGN